MNSTPHFKSTRRMYVSVLSFIPLAALFLSGCGSTMQLSSDWTASRLQVDGKAGEWTSILHPVADRPLALAVRNDSSWFYVCLESSDRDIRNQILGAGLTVSFESPKTSKFGVRFPLGMTGLDGPRSPLSEIEIIGSGSDDRTRYSVLALPGIEVKLGESGGMVVYKLKVPLKASQAQPFALGIDPGMTVSLKIETGKMDRGMPPGGDMGGGPGGAGTGGMGSGGGVGSGGQVPGAGEPDGMGPPSGGGRGRGRGDGAGPSAGHSQGLDLKADVKLAAGPAGSPTIRTTGSAGK